MNRAYSWIKLLSTWCVGLLCALAFGQAGAVSGAISTTTNINWSGLSGGNGQCLNGPSGVDPVNCNIYTSKQDVWFSGLPVSAALGDGTYFFAVLVPGGQGGNQNPNDCTTKNLSDSCHTTNTPGGDAWTNREFTITGGQIFYSGSHAFDQANNKLNLFPYDNTTNHGGEYILAVCRVPTTISDRNPPGVDPSDCKYDAFKVLPANAAAVIACKFNDWDGVGDGADPTINIAPGPNEPLLNGWTINADGVVDDSGNTGSLGLVTGEQGDPGCVNFTVDLSSKPTVTLQEELQDGWDQTAPNTGTKDYTVDTSVDPWVVTLNPLKSGDVVTVYFGNTNTKAEQVVQVKKDASPDIQYTWNIKKDATETKVTQSGTTHTFTYNVTVGLNDPSTFPETLSGTIMITSSYTTDQSVIVTDTPSTAGAKCTLTDPNNSQNVDNPITVIVPANGELDVAYECSFPAGFTGKGTNEVTVTSGADPPDQNINAVFDADYDFSGPSVTHTDTCVDVTDPLGSAGVLGTACVGDPPPETFTYTIDRKGTAGTCKDFDNTATFTTNDTGTTGSSKKTVTLCVGADLTVSKTATPSFTRTYKWQISKNVNKTKVEQSGGTYTFNYEVDVSETGFDDSAWQVSGTITVKNPNDFEAIDATVSDAVSGGVCQVNGGATASVTVPASGSVDVSYTCTFASKPAYSTDLTNTPTVTWDSSAYKTPTGSATGPKKFQFTAPTSTVNKTITVKDTWNGVTTTLGTLTATDVAPFASAAYKYSHTVNAPTGGTCKEYDNTAKIVETGQSAGQAVTICNTATGGLTMGFWQNKNGQAIITGGASTAGVCNSGTWLRQYAPFQDLSATASCSAVATYVTNIVKAANASGAAMNAMLKAQMLATALDVYFSDPALGGNKISAATPLGGVKIDLTTICKMIDSSSGGTCSGTTENAGPAFGGATSLTVSQLLAYAASQSNAGGTSWYGQVKTTQGLAKDTFDAINNDVANIAP